MKPTTHGQSLVEFALVIPVFLVVFLAVLDLGRVVWANNALASAAREATRFAIVHGGSPTTACPVGPPIPNKTRIPPASASCPFPAPSKQAVVNVALQHAIAAGTGTTVTVCYGVGCSGNTNTAGAVASRGTPVTVTVSSNIPVLTGSFLGISSHTASGSATMHISH
jgi:Flp pilus assembly protein TadG